MSSAASALSKSIEALISCMMASGASANRPPHILFVMVPREEPRENGRKPRNTDREGRRPGPASASRRRSVAAVYVTLGGNGNGGERGPAGRDAAARSRARPAGRRARWRRLQLAREPQEPRRPRLHRDGRASQRRSPHFAGKVAPGQSLGHVVRPLPAGDAGARPAAGGARRRRFRRRAGLHRHRRRGRGRRSSSTASGCRHLPLYTDPTTEIFETLKQRGLALGLPVTLLVDRDGCHLGHMNGPAEWDSDEGEGADRGGDQARRCSG